MPESEALCCPCDDCGHPIKPGCRAHVHVEVIAVGPTAVTGKTKHGQLVTCDPGCFHCDDHPEH